MRTDAQTAVRAAMAVAEVMGCFFAMPNLGPGEVQMTLVHDQGRAELRISGPSVPEFLPGATQGVVSLPARMLRQFAMQLNGTLKVTHDADRVTILIDFPTTSAAG
jgi:hypothetical protein